MPDIKVVAITEPTPAESIRQAFDSLMRAISFRCELSGGERVAAENRGFMIL